MCILGVKDRNPFFLETQDHGRKVKVRHVGEGGGCAPGQGSRQRLTGWQNHGMEPGDGAGSRRRRPPPGQAPGAGRARAWPRGAAPLTTRRRPLGVTGVCPRASGETSVRGKTKLTSLEPPELNGEELMSTLREEEKEEKEDGLGWSVPARPPRWEQGA